MNIFLLNSTLYLQTYKLLSKYIKMKITLFYIHLQCTYTTKKPPAWQPLYYLSKYLETSSIKVEKG